MPPTSPSGPSAKQLAYLKALAQRTATSFTYPRDRAEASREIERLRRLPAAGRTDQRTHNHTLACFPRRKTG